MKHNLKSREFACLALLFSAICLSQSAHADIADGTVTMTWNQTAWATMATGADPNNPLVVTQYNNPTPAQLAANPNMGGVAAGPVTEADAPGQRYEFIQGVFGSSYTPTTYVASQWDLTAAQNVPVTQTSFTFAVNTYNTNSFADGYAVTTYNGDDPITVAGTSKTNKTTGVVTTTPSYTTTGIIGIGGGFQIGSDVNEPGGSLVMGALELENINGTWYLATGPSQAAPGILFQLVNVTTSEVNGQLSLDADYEWGNQSGLPSQLDKTSNNWYAFFNGYNGQLNTTQILGHIDLTPSAVPVPAAGWLFGSALLGLIGYKRRTHSTLSV